MDLSIKPHALIIFFSLRNGLDTNVGGLENISGG